MHFLVSEVPLYLERPLAGPKFWANRSLCWREYAFDLPTGIPSTKRTCHNKPFNQPNFRLLESQTAVYSKADIQSLLLETEVAATPPYQALEL